MEYQTKRLGAEYDYLAPDQSEIRLLLSGRNGDLAHCTLQSSKTSIAVKHRTVEEIWYFIEGLGEVWRKQGEKEEIISVEPGLSLTIPVGTHFQFRNIGKEPLKFLICTMPPWPGKEEATVARQHWQQE